MWISGLEDQKEKSSPSIEQKYRETEFMREKTKDLEERPRARGI